MRHSVIICGSSGMVGRGVLLECLDSPKIASVLVVNRKSIGMQHPKLKEILLNDLMQVDEIKNDLVGYDACFFCAGISAFRKSEEEYTKITYDLTLHFAKSFLSLNKDSVFCYVSGTGTDSTEKGRMMWARVKGKTENDLLALPFRAAYMFRPGFIQPLRGIKSRTGSYNVLYALFSPLYAIIKHFPSLATNTIVLGKAMINILDKSSDVVILENRQINALGKMD